MHKRGSTVTGQTQGDRFFLGIDLGGTNIKIGIVNDVGESLAKVSCPTLAEQGPEEGLRRFADSAFQALEKCKLGIEDIAAVGLATPGTMDIPAGMLLDPPNLPGWDNFPIRQRVEDIFNKPTYLQNDANAAAYGEYWVGVGKGQHSLVLWTLGTGIGCGIIIGNRIISGEHSHGSECGHIIIDMDGGRLCGTGQRGTLEAYASAKSLVLRCHEALDSEDSDGRRESSLSHLRTAGQDITPLKIAEAAEAGDQLAEELIMETARYMGIGTTTVMHTINPSLFVLGGAMTFGQNETDLGRRFLERIRSEVHHRAFPVPAQKTKIEYAKLGGDAGYIGAAGFARREFDAKPGDERP